MLLVLFGRMKLAFCISTVWCVSFHAVNASEDFYVQYMARQYKGLRDVYCPDSAVAMSEWAEFFGEGCEGRKCRRSSKGLMTVLYFRCKRSAQRQDIRCRSGYESVFPQCCLPLCNDPSYFEDTY